MTAPVLISSYTVDTNYEVIQESYFYHLFGVQEVGYHACIEIDTGKTTLFVPKTDLVMRIFQSPPRKADVTKKYGLPAIYKSKMQQFITNLHPVALFR